VLLDISPLPPLSIQTETFDVPGVYPSWEIHLGAPSLPPGIFIFGPSRIPTRDTIEVAFYNGTESVVYPGSQTIRVLAF
jgi:hypothetical protein